MTARRLTIGVIGIVLLLVAAVGAYSLGALVRGAPQLGGTELEERPQVGDLTLVAGNGERVSLADFQGDYLIVFFGYTNCPDVCPLTMARLGSIYRSLEEPEGLEVVMVTVDPERDDPGRIDGYAKGFHPDFVGLGGDEESLSRAAERFFVGHNHQADGLIAHNTQVLLVDRDGHFWRIYNDEAQRALEQDLRNLLS